MRVVSEEDFGQALYFISIANVSLSLALNLALPGREGVKIFL